MSGMHSFRPRTFISLLAAVLTVLAAAWAGRATAGPQDADIVLLRDTVAASQNAFATRDIAAMGRLWIKTDYVSAVHPSGQDPFLGWERVRRSWLRTFAHNRDMEVESLAGKAEVVGDVAWVIDAARIDAFQTQTGQPILMANVIGTKIFERVGSDWLLVHWHTHLPEFKAVADDHESSPAGLPDDELEDELDRVNHAFYDAFMARDIMAMADIWGAVDHVSAVHPDHLMPFLGVARVLTSFELVFANLTDISIGKEYRYAKRIAGDVAWLVDSREIAGTRRDTKERIIKSNVIITKIFQRQNRAWRLVHYHAHNGPGVSPPGDGHDHTH